MEYRILSEKIRKATEAEHVPSREPNAEEALARFQKRIFEIMSLMERELEGKFASLPGDARELDGFRRHASETSSR